jgi:flagella basal body P-ring formation protein FlgA
LAPAPDAGKALVLGYDDLRRIVETFNLTWPAASPSATITLRADRSVIDWARIETAVHAAIVQKVTGKVRLRLDPVPQSTLVVRGLAPFEVDVVAIQVAPTHDTVTATVRARRGGDELTRFDLGGTIDTLVDLPVLVRPLRVGDIVNPRDVATIETPAREIKIGTVTTAEALVGMAVRRPLPAQRAVAEADLMAPILVRKNEMITVSLRNGRLSVTAKMRALGEGAKGDIIQVMQPSSKKILEARVSALGQALVE